MAAKSKISILLHMLIDSSKVTRVKICIYMKDEELKVCHMEESKKNIWKQKYLFSILLGRWF